MKKIISLLITLSILCLMLAACTKDETTVNIGVMNGPTGMGMAKLINDNGLTSDKYNFTTYSSPTDATAALGNGSLDMLCVPTNLAANLANKQSGFISVAAINCLGSLYILTDGSVQINSISDLADKTVYYGEPTSTTGPIIKYILEKNNVNANLIVESTNEIVAGKISSGEASIAILPEPKATAAISQANMNGYSYSIKLNLSEEWSKVSDDDTPLTMGCIIVRNEFISEHKSLLNKFLREYKASIEYIGNNENHDSAAKMIVDAGILPKLPVAKSALNNLYGSIVYIDGDDMRTALLGFYEAINLKAPSNEFFYD